MIKIKKKMSYGLCAWRSTPATHSVQRDRRILCWEVVREHLQISCNMCGFHWDEVLHISLQRYNTFRFGAWILDFRKNLVVFIFRMSSENSVKWKDQVLCCLRQQRRLSCVSDILVSKLGITYSWCCCPQVTLRTAVFWFMPSYKFYKAAFTWASVLLECVH